MAANALLFTAPGCPHCPGVKASLEKLQQEGLIAELEVISIAENQEKAQEYGVRSVPWLKLGEFTLTGAQTPQELREWAEKAADTDSSAGLSDYYEQLLGNGQLSEAEEQLQQHPEQIEALLTLIADTEAKIQVRLGVGALLEQLEGSEALQGQVESLGELSQHSDHRIRADACHYLGLTHSEAARDYLQPRLEDENSEVREIATDAIETLDGNG